MCAQRGHNEHRAELYHNLTDHGIRPQATVFRIRFAGYAAVNRQRRGALSRTEACRPWLFRADAVAVAWLPISRVYNFGNTVIFP